MTLADEYTYSLVDAVVDFVENEVVDVSVVLVLLILLMLMSMLTLRDKWKGC